jgi:deoxyribodipyrimidine photo-lyase
MSSARPAVVWFRRDLRLHDHPSLAAAAADDRVVVPLFVVDPRLVLGRFASPNRTWFLLETVRELASHLAGLGAPLVVRFGDPVTIVPAVAAEAGAADVFVSRDHAPYGRRRDRLVAAGLEASGIAFHPKRGVLVHEPEEVATADGRPFSVYSPFRRAWEARPRREVLPAPAAMPAHDIAPGHVPSVAELGLGDGPTAAIDAMPTPGERSARARLDLWTLDAIDRYAEARDRLDLTDGTSRLSADLHVGSLSALEVVERAVGAGEGRRVFLSELVWREFYAHVLFHWPDVRRQSFRREFEAIGWSTDAAVLDAWRDGRTGYPVVDAAMRQLLATGWMHNRARMIVASFLTKDLLIHWRSGEWHFMRHLIDGDVASNNGGWQWSASTGTDAQPYFRIFNPVAQSRRFDPDGDYSRRWLPELADVTGEHIHAPWEMSEDEQVAAGCRIGLDYPAPIVDHAEARTRALATFETARRTGRPPVVPLAR